MSDKYFPTRPYDVTCQTCPYWGGNWACQRSPEIATVTNPLSHFCGEHPWFVAQREDLRAQATAEWCNGVLADRLQELVAGLSK